MRVTAVGPDGFSISATCCGSFTGSEYTAVGEHQFAAPLRNKEEVRNEIEILKNKSRVASWPPGLGAIFSALLLLGCLSCVTDINPAVGSIYIQKIHDVSMILLRSNFNARVAVGVILAAHAVEAYFVVPICTRLKFTRFHIVSWVSMVILIGYPCTSRVLFLEKISKTDFAVTPVLKRGLGGKKVSCTHCCICNG